VVPETRNQLIGKRAIGLGGVKKGNAALDGLRTFVYTSCIDVSDRLSGRPALPCSNHRREQLCAVGWYAHQF
jgi:hypothetical protein